MNTSSRGIPDRNLRNIAKLRSFNSGAQLLESFQNVEANSPKTLNGALENNEQDSVTNPTWSATIVIAEDNLQKIVASRKEKTALALRVANLDMWGCNQYKKNSKELNDYVSHIEVPLYSKTISLTPIYLDSGSPIGIIKNSYMLCHLEINEVQFTNLVGKCVKM